MSDEGAPSSRKSTSAFAFGAWQRDLREASRSRDIRAGAAATALWLESFADFGTGLNARPAVETLAAIQQVSEATIRRHLKELTSAGFIQRTHGHTRNRPATYAIRRREHQREDANVTPHLQIARQHKHQVAQQTVHERYPTAKPSNTPQTPKRSKADAINYQRSEPTCEDVDELVGYLLEAVDDEHVWLPNLDLQSDEQRAEQMIWQVLRALAAAGKINPAAYLRGIYVKGGPFRFGLAVREKFHFLVAEKPLVQERNQLR